MSASSEKHPRTLEAVLLAFLLLGVSWRVLRYALRFPFWGDEAYLILNFVDRDFAGLTQPLGLGQVAPILFLWSERAATLLLGGSELALRLLPLAAGLGALLLFRGFVRSSLSPLSGALAVAILSVSYYAVRHSCEVKPYALDLLFSLALLLPAARWLQEPHRAGFLGLLAAIVPVALAASYPSVFVAVSVSLVLLPVVWRLGNGKAWMLFVAYNVLLAAGFLAAYTLVGSAQFEAMGGTRNPYWGGSFPPREPLPFVRWMALIHTGNLFAYPVGARDGGSAVTFLLSLFGAWRLSRLRESRLLLLLTVPFGLTFLAAALRYYPYGGSARVAQHLAPSICVLAGVGLAALLGKSPGSATGRRRLTAVTLGLLGLVGVVGMLRDVRKPYKTPSDIFVRDLVDEIAAQADHEDQVVILNLRQEVTPPGFEWYLRQRGAPLSWGGGIDRKRLQTTTRDIWFLSFGDPPVSRRALEARLRDAARPMVLQRHAIHLLHFGWATDPPVRFELFHWKLLPRSESSGGMGTRQTTATSIFMTAGALDPPWHRSPISVRRSAR